MPHSRISSATPRPHSRGWCLRATSTVALVSASMLASLVALESVYFEVYPGADLYGAMGKVEGSAPVTNQAREPWYIKSIVATPIGRPEALIEFPPTRFDPAPCDPEAFRTYIHMVHVNPSSTTNTEMIIKFKGTLITCDGTEESSIPEFESTIVHADLDVDSDNNATDAAKPPQGDDAEDNLEEAEPGVYLCVNRNRNESGGGITGPEDFERDGIDPSDGDLVRARLTIKPKAGRATFSYSMTTIRLYRENGELPVGSMFQGTVTSSLALRARAGRFGFRNAFITIGVQYGDARLRMRWASLMGPQSQRVFGE